MSDKLLEYATAVVVLPPVKRQEFYTNNMEATVSLVFDKDDCSDKDVSVTIDDQYLEAADCRELAKLFTEIAEVLEGKL